MQSSLALSRNKFQLTRPGDHVGSGPPGNLVTVLPITREPKKLPSRVRVVPPEGRLRLESWAICEQVRTMSTQRLGSRLGALRLTLRAAASEALKLMLDLEL